MGEAERQAAEARRLLRREELAVDRVTALAVQQLAGLEIALGGGDHVGMEADRAARRFLAQADGSNRDPDLESDQVPALVHYRVTPRRVGLEHVLLEAVLLVLGRGLEYDPHALADLVGDGAAILLERRGDLDLPLVMQVSAFRRRSHDERQVLDGAGREGKPVGRWRQPGGIRHGGALDGRLRAVEEAVEHLGIEPAASGLLLVEAPVLPHRLGRRLGEVRQPLVAAARRRDREARGARPVDQLADQRRLIAIGEAVDHAGLGRALGEQGAAKGVGLDRHHDHALAVAERFQRVLDRGNRIAGRFDDHVDLGMGNQRPPVVGQEGVAVAPRLGEGPRRRHFGLPAEPCQVLARPRRREVGDAQQVDTRRGRDLAEIHGAELAGADQADAQRLGRSRALEQHAMQVHWVLPLPLRYSAAALRRPARATASSSQASIGVKSRWAI